MQAETDKVVDRHEYDGTRAPITMTPMQNERVTAHLQRLVDLDLIGTCVTRGVMRSLREHHECLTGTLSEIETYCANGAPNTW